MYVGTLHDVIYKDSEGDNYASGVFTPTWFGSEYIDRLHRYDG